MKHNLASHTNKTYTYMHTCGKYRYNVPSVRTRQRALCARAYVPMACASPMFSLQAGTGKGKIRLQKCTTKYKPHSAHSTQAHDTWLRSQHFSQFKPDNSA